MNTQPIKLTLLHPHPANSNVMPEELLSKLIDHIDDTNRYPPIIVRPIPTDQDNASSSPHYQILDGHHRVIALKRLGHQSAQCVVWQADDREALLLLATLNRLQGQDDPQKRAGLIAALAERHDTKSLTNLLPERIEQVKKLLELNTHPPRLRSPKPIESMTVAVHFFLLPNQKRRLNERLDTIGGTREEALMTLIDHPN